MLTTERSSHPLPLHTNHNETVDDQLVEYTDDLPLRELSEANRTLAESLDMVEQYQDQALLAQNEALAGIVTRDAYDLVANILPAPLVKRLGVPAKRPDDIGFEQPPCLNDLFLLIRSYDATQDPVLRSYIELILSARDLQPSPTISHLLANACDASLINGNPIMYEYKQLALVIDNKLDATITPLY
jgi:hypothetical protein